VANAQMYSPEPVTHAGGSAVKATASIAEVAEDILARHAPGVSLDAAALSMALPALAKQPAATAEIEEAAKSLPTEHNLHHGDARDMAQVEDESLELVLTSPPYWTLKEYPGREGQMGSIEDYEEFLGQLALVWNECWRVLVEGGRLIIVVGDVCLARKRHGHHAVVPLHASIQEACRRIGFLNLAPIIWYKIANAAFEVENGSSFLGKPYEPNSIIKNDIEYILMQRKPSAYRSPSPATRVLSLISAANHREWFRQIWSIHGASTRNHPAPFPLELASRLIRMFSFVGDTVLDPFMGTGTTNLAASLFGRNSTGVEISPEYVGLASSRMHDEHDKLFSSAAILVHGL